MTTTNEIRKVVTLRAPRTRVWRAISDAREFGTWFRVALEGPFVAGETVRGKITYPGYEGLVFEARVERIEPERYFSYRWCPYEVPSGDYSQEPTTLVEFQLEDRGAETLLTIVESGFDQIPAHRRDEAFRLNEGGWTEQVKNIEAHVATA